MTPQATIFPGEDPGAVTQASAVLRGGGLVGLPTETVYGLACDALNPRAVAGVFAAKERPSFDPLIVHVRDLPHAQTLAIFDDTAIALAKRFWPGALTLVLPKHMDIATGKPIIPGLVTAGLDRVGLRVPAHPVAQALLRDSGLALAAPSANRFGSISPTTAQHVADELAGRVDLILDGGPCTQGVESTVVSIDAGGVSVLRLGATTVESLRAALPGVQVQLVRPTSNPGRETVSRNASLPAPGMTDRHYAPRTPLRLVADITYKKGVGSLFLPQPESHAPGEKSKKTPDLLCRNPPESDDSPVGLGPAPPDSSPPERGGEQGSCPSCDENRGFLQSTPDPFFAHGESPRTNRFGLIALGDVSRWANDFSQTRSLSETGDLTEAAANLFAVMRDLDGLGLDGIVAVGVPDEGLGRAINDRLRRASVR